MPTQDGFDPTLPLPQFLAEKAEQDFGTAPERAVAPSRLFKMSMLIVAALATGIAVLALGDPVALVAQMSASLVGSSPPPSTPVIQSVAEAPAPVPSAFDAQTLPPATKDTPAREEIAASEPAARDPAEKTESPSESLFSQFQAWAAEQDAQARGGPKQGVEDTPAQVAENVQAAAAANVRAPDRRVQKRRQVRAVQNARAEVRTQNRMQARRAQSASAERPPVQDPRAQDQAASQTPSFLQPLFGPRN